MATKPRKKESATFRVFEAVFEDGVLRPLQDPGLAEHHRFAVQVQELGAGDPGSGLAASISIRQRNGGERTITSRSVTS
jgi:predicted DNA-binding antitoxin AbrB/MazE fold protein